MSVTHVLLLTNRDSDNVGDQIIEASVISLIRAAFKNLGREPEEYVISSRAASIISRKYMRTGDPALLETARAAISAADVIVFGGAPLFNYAYQSFYLRTIKTLQLAEEYGVPVLFSSIGVEPFDASNPKSLELKAALALSCVRQITTRDDIDSLRQYVEGTSVPVAHVADPAVFADVVFGTSDNTPPAGRRVGLVVTRAGIFHDNGIEFSEADQRRFWVSVIDELKRRGYDYSLFTTGHFTDEVFLDAMVRAENIPLRNVASTINSPEELIDQIQACSGVIAYRLHASITSFAYGVPSIGLSWNFKVPFFYDSVGHGDRALASDKWTAVTVVDGLEKAIAEGVRKDEEFLMSVYTTLFDGLRSVVQPGVATEPYSYDELRAHLPRYGGTGLKRYREKMRRKLRRTYEEFHKATSQSRASTSSAVGRSLKRALHRVRALWR